MRSLKPFICLFTLMILGTTMFGGCKKSSEVTAQSQNNRNIVLSNDYSNKDRNRLLKEDIAYLGKKLPKKHKNLFYKMSEDEFTSQINAIIEQVDKKNNSEIFALLQKLIASVGDAHTCINTFDGFTYPLTFYSIKDSIYVINADKSLKEVLYSKVTKINNVDIKEITTQLTSLIPSENSQWVLASLPNYLNSPGYLFGLGLIPDETTTSFEFQTPDGDIITKNINTLPYGQYPDYALTYDKERNVYAFDSQKEDYYWYDYMEKENILYLKYNVCGNMNDLSFKDFNKDMWDFVASSSLSKIVIDLRHNSGGNSTIINPFIKSLKSYVKKHPDTSVYIITGRKTFSSGIMAVLDIKAKVPAIVVGEATGGSPNSYGEVKLMNLPNTQLPVSYSIKYFELTKDNANTIKPDITIQPDVQDFIDNKDVVMEYVLQ